MSKQILGIGRCIYCVYIHIMLPLSLDSHNYYDAHMHDAHFYDKMFVRIKLTNHGNGPFSVFEKSAFSCSRFANTQKECTFDCVHPRFMQSEDNCRIQILCEYSSPIVGHMIRLYDVLRVKQSGTTIFLVQIPVLILFSNVSMPSLYCSLILSSFS